MSEVKLNMIFDVFLRHRVVNELVNVLYYRQNMSTYKELCSIANDLNQPDLIYKFLHLANHHATWNTKKVGRQW